MKMINVMGRSDFIRAIAPGETAVWYGKPGESIEIEMRANTATCCRLACKITQKAAMMVLLDAVPVPCVVVTKL